MTKFILKGTHSCQTLCHPMDYKVHGNLQARILEGGAFPFSRRSSQLRNQTGVSGIAGGFSTSWTTREAQSQRKAMSKNIQTTTQLNSFPMPVRWCSKSSKLGFNSKWTKNFQMCQLDLEKAEEPEIKLSTSIGSWKRQENSRKLLDCFIDCAKAFDSVDFNKLWKILKNMIIPEYFNCLLRNT